MSHSQTYISIPCPICGSLGYKVKYPDTLGIVTPRFDYNFSPEHNHTYRIVKCLECGHGYSSPRPEKLFINYKEVIDEVYLKNAPQRIETAKKVILHLRKIKTFGRLLDVGCATGDFLSVAEDYYNVEGIELSHWSAEIARKKGFVVNESELGELQDKDVYDIITLWGVIEHFENPVQEIINIRKLLKRGGIVSLWTGDFDSILSKVLGKNWWWVQGQHINLFSRKSLYTLFENNGFKILDISLYPYVMAMRSISESLGRYPLINMLTKNILNTKYLAEKRITIKLPGEMLATFRKE
jgi:2-polyprenyl-3-methyl-5-hydroxy-6-metoxy-1,4-benzoquinol methylase